MFKTATLALAAVVVSATFASAESYISNFVMEQNDDTHVELGTVRAEGNGVVEIYAFHKGEIGQLIGSEAVQAGANLDVNINVRETGTDAIAILKVDGQIVDTQEIDFN